MADVHNKMTWKAYWWSIGLIALLEGGLGLMGDPEGFILLGDPEGFILLGDLDVMGGRGIVGGPSKRVPGCYRDFLFDIIIM